MKHWILGAVLLLNCVAIPARAEGPATAGELQRRLVDLRWELHELTYSDVATPQQREAKRIELCGVEGRIQALSALPRLTASPSSAAVAQIAELPTAQRESAAVSSEPSPVLVTPALRTVAVAPDKPEPQA